MVAQLDSQSRDTLVYPDSDGQPMAENTQQFRWITVIQGNLDWIFAQDPQVLVVGDLLWYPVEGDNKTRQAPDVMVVFGVPKGDRGSYMQWREGNIAPQVVFEILSPGNRLTEMLKKQMFYDRYGVEEYYIYDPDRHDLTALIRGATPTARLEAVEDLNGWVSPRLGIRFELTDTNLHLFQPNGQPFLTYVELGQQFTIERTRAEQERARADRLADRLRELGIDPDALSTDG
ncbi:MAG: Uma2 family endonuclease [Oscillatoriales cyanobacterium]|nr:MAG: Uma2 family endonuclease [Oscillatoriales cyanobacterium]